MDDGNEISISAASASADNSTKGKSENKAGIRDQARPVYRAALLSGGACPHSSLNTVPICWDCAEEGHVFKADENSSNGGDVQGQFRKHLRRQDQDSSWGGSTLASSELSPSSVLSGWQSPRSDLEARYINGVFPPGYQSIAPEWHPPEPGLEVVQPLAPEKIVVTKKKKWGWSRVFETWKTCALRRKALYWILLGALLLVLALASAVSLALTLKPHTTVASSN